MIGEFGECFDLPVTHRRTVYQQVPRSFPSFFKLAEIRQLFNFRDPFMAGRHMVRYLLIVVASLPQVVKEVIDPRAQVVYRENTADDPHKRKPDITKAKTLLGWEPKIALREGLPLMVDDFKERLSVQ
jgi:hypothetical protein